MTLPNPPYCEREREKTTETMMVRDGREEKMRKTDKEGVCEGQSVRNKERVSERVR